MSDDIFDTRPVTGEVELEDILIEVGDDINLMEKDHGLKTLHIGAGWDINSFDAADAMDVDISIFLLDRNMKTRKDSDFIFYNQPEAFDGKIKHLGDSRSGAGDGDDEGITIDLQAVPFDVLQIPIVMSIYKGFEKKQTLESIKNAYIRIANADNHYEMMRFHLNDVFVDKKETGAIVGWLNREGPKWHFKAEPEFFAGGLGEIARGYDIIVNQE